jgi:hypothetical protein
VRGLGRSHAGAKVAELADAPDLGSGGVTHGGSSPPFRTILAGPGRGRPGVGGGTGPEVSDTHPYPPPGFCK